MTQKRKRRSMKMPNGYGSIIQLSGRRRRPFAVRITTGWTDDGKQKYSYLGYFEDRKEAMIALAEYNKDPYDLDAKKITFADVFESWSEQRYKKLTKNNANAYNAAYQAAAELHDIKFVDLRKAHMQAVIDGCKKSHSFISKIKSLFNQMYKFAMENDLVDKNYSAFVEMPPDETVSTRKPFSEDEIKKLWECVNKVDFVDVVLIMIYTGMRPGEMITIETKNVHLTERYMRGGIKTEAGKDRAIPIHQKILPLVEARMNQNHEFLISQNNGKPFPYTTFLAERFQPLMKELEMTHKPHDCRHTFATLMDNANANKLSIKKIMGHKSQDVTDRVYTHKDIEELIKAIDLLP